MFNQKGVSIGAIDLTAAAQGIPGAEDLRQNTRGCPKLGTSEKVTNSYTTLQPGNVLDDV